MGQIKEYLGKFVSLRSRYPRQFGLVCIFLLCVLCFICGYFRGQRDVSNYGETAKSIGQQLEEAQRHQRVATEQIERATVANHTAQRKISESREITGRIERSINDSRRSLDESARLIDECQQVVDEVIQRGKTN